MIDLRSDTVTQPTPSMRRAMLEVEVGDDVYGEDPTVNALEARAAALTGKEAGLLVTSGTQGNLVALLTHAPHGTEVILGELSHIAWWEVNGMATLGGLMPRLVPDVDGAPRPEDVERAIRPRNIHAGRTALICLENTHADRGGRPVPPERIAAVAEVAQRQGLPVHLDGARVFNAAVALGVDVRAITQHVDSVTFCLSKGLSAPVGSVLCGSQAFIERARGIRKMLGAGMRQAGWIAAAGIVALEQLVPRLAEDHANARALAERLARIPGLAVDLERVQSNLVFFTITAPQLTARELVARLAAAGVRCNAPGERRIRMVTYRGISREDVEYAAEAVARAMKGELAPAERVAVGSY